MNKIYIILIFLSLFIFYFKTIILIEGALNE